jgi:hypothetical protein
MMSSAMPSQRCALAEMVVARIARQIGERQDRDRRMADGFGRQPLAERASEARRLRARVLDLEHLDRLGNVLEPRLAKRTQQRSRQFAHRRAERAADQNAARIGQGLEARRDIDAMSISDRFLQRHLADIEADAEFDRLAVAPDRLLAKLGLDLDREPQRLTGAVEQGQNSVAGDVGDPPAVIADQIPEQLNRAGDLVGATDLILLHAPAELDHVGDHDGGAFSTPVAAQCLCPLGLHAPCRRTNSDSL